MECALERKPVPTLYMQLDLLDVYLVHYVGLWCTFTKQKYQRTLTRRRSNVH